MWEFVVLASVAIGALAYVAGLAIRRVEDSRRDLARQVILLSATSRGGAQDFLLAKAAQEGRLAPRPTADDPTQDDEWEALVEERRKDRNRDLMNEWAEAEES